MRACVRVCVCVCVCVCLCERGEYTLEKGRQGCVHAKCCVLETRNVFVFTDTECSVCFCETESGVSAF